MSHLGAHVRSNVVGYIALFFALGMGTAWAATELSKNEVKSKHIKAGAVKNADLADGSVTSPKVENGSLRGEDFAPGQLPQGPRGEQGVPGAPGEPGDDATNLFAYIADRSDADAAVQYGSGVTGVTEPAASDAYFVNFNRSLVNCVVQVTPGFGDPLGNATSQPSFPIVETYVGTASEVAVSFRNAAGNFVDSSFMITAFC